MWEDFAELRRIERMRRIDSGWFFGQAHNKKPTTKTNSKATLRFSAERYTRSREIRFIRSIRLISEKLPTWMPEDATRRTNPALGHQETRPAKLTAISDART
jgi:hypothetical protein